MLLGVHLDAHAAKTSATTGCRVLAHLAALPFCLLRAFLTSFQNNWRRRCLQCSFVSITHAHKHAASSLPPTPYHLLLHYHTNPSSAALPFLLPCKQDLNCRQKLFSHAFHLSSTHPHTYTTAGAAAAATAASATARVSAAATDHASAAATPRASGGDLDRASLGTATAASGGDLDRVSPGTAGIGESVSASHSTVRPPLPRPPRLRQCRAAARQSRTLWQVCGCVG